RPPARRWPGASAAAAAAASASPPGPTPSSAPRTPSRPAPPSCGRPAGRGAGGSAWTPAAPSRAARWPWCRRRGGQGQRQQQQRQAGGADLGCYLFNCTHRGRPVCRFAPHRGYSTYSRRRAEEEYDEPPLCKAGQDVVLQSPVDWVLLDGRESSDDHGIVQYEWTLLQGDSAVEMKVPQPGTLKLSHFQEGTYIFQLTVTDTAGQRSSDNVSVTVLPMAHSAVACVGVCSRYQFICDDGCCIDITFACDGVKQCPDGSDETFCQNLSQGRKTVTHAAFGTTQQRTCRTD
uniref:Low-density lipoprotein receptor-related protein 11 n=1 Tax=Anas platyrhynchos TaxID=8839 RepID=A0A8B9TB30_ANAPL